MAAANDLPRLEDIRAAAFAPVSASFRAIPGVEIYPLAQAREDDAQRAFLASLLAGKSRWAVYAASADSRWRLPLKAEVL